MSLAVPAPDFGRNPEVVGGTANVKQLADAKAEPQMQVAQNWKCKHHFDSFWLSHSSKLVSGRKIVVARNDKKSWDCLVGLLWICTLKNGTRLQIVLLCSLAGWTLDFAPAELPSKIRHQFLRAWNTPPGPRSQSVSPLNLDSSDRLKVQPDGAKRSGKFQDVSRSF